MRQFHRTAPPLPEGDGVLETLLETEMKADPVRTRAVHWVVRSSDAHPWGLLSLTNVSFQHKRAEVLLGVLPGAPFGLATAAMLRLFHFVFHTQNFNKLYSMVYADNPHSLKGTLHLGFKQEGILRQHTLDPATNDYVDMIQTGILRAEAFSDSNLRLMKKLLNNTSAQ